MRMGTYYRSELLNFLNVKADKENVLDIGCFDGYWLSTQSAKNKYALDVDIKKDYDNVIYTKGSALEIPFEDSKFDKVFSFDVIEHVPKGMEKKFISELLRVTKFGGEIIITTPSKDIKIFPSFLTNWTSKKWGHHKCNGYDLEEIEDFFLTKPRYLEIKYLPARTYLNFYLLLKNIWRINLSFSKKIIKLVAKRDSKLSNYNRKGYIFIKAIK